MILPMPRMLAAALLLTSACTTGLAPLPMPAGMAPASVDEAAAWAATTRPAENRELRFRFQFVDEQGSAGGRGRRPSRSIRSARPIRHCP